ncbi:probable 4-coumarate--CoA ligase 3 [Pecten maximus]|uniref:probable 4-coumarate--CoA ligase 3 n=1 Tax=Pecten maximus TaxID=6579 RepID=UPI001458107B|nr:probable 4-coumarate--CoA ligase 3 [Pecten maximus]
MADVCGKFCNTLIAGYGSTELSVVAFIEVKDNMELGALGSLSDGMEVKIVDEDWNTVHREELGEICIRCPWMLKGYRTVPGTDRVTLTDGWMNTGDIGFIRSDDSLFIKGKFENVIKRMTLKILSGDVEECIAEIPEVKAAVVVAVPDQRVYEDVCACVVLDQSTGVTMADVELHCRKRLGDTITGDAPTYYLRFEAIPRLNSGKPDRMKVKQHALEMLDIS